MKDIYYDAIFATVLFVFIAGSIVFGLVQERRGHKEYGEKSYEFVIDDKYEKLGSRFHLLGGRATETEWHIVYRYRVTNRPEDKTASGWKRTDREASHTAYTHYEVGKAYTGSSPYLW